MKCFVEVVLGVNCRRTAAYYAEQDGVVFLICEKHSAELTDGWQDAEMRDRLRAMPDNPVKRFERSSNE